MWTQYVGWVSDILLRADFGNSLWQNSPVRDQLLDRLPVTFELGLMALIVALLLAIPIGVYSAVRQDTAGDYLTRSFSILMLAVPELLAGHHGDGVPVDLVGLVAGGQLRSFHGGPAAEPEADAAAGGGARHWRCRRSRCG